MFYNFHGKRDLFLVTKTPTPHAEVFVMLQKRQRLARKLLQCCKNASASRGGFCNATKTPAPRVETFVTQQKCQRLARKLL